MPNWCSIKMTVTCKDNKTANNVYEVLQLVESIANEHSKPMYLGSLDRYIFDFSSDIQNNEIVLEGVTRWYVDPKDFVQWVEFLIVQGDDISSIEMSYEERGCQVYGCYSYDGESNEIYDKYIPIDKIPPFREVYSEFYDEILEAYLEDNGTIEYVKKLNIQDLIEKRKEVKKEDILERKQEMAKLIY